MLQHIENPGEGFHPPSPYHGGDMNLRVRPRVKIGVFAAVAVVDAKLPNLDSDDRPLNYATM